MTMFHLRASSEKAMYDEVAQVLDGVVVQDENGEDALRLYTHRWALDWDIPIVLTPAVLDTEGAVSVPAVMSTDFHANLLIIDPDALLDFPFGIESVNPVNPQRGFA